MTFNDTTRTALLTFVRAIFPVLVLYGIYNFTDTQIAATIVLIEAGVTLFASVFKYGQAPGPDVTQKIQNQLQWNRAQLEALPDQVLSLLMPVGFQGDREALLKLLTTEPKKGG